MNPDGPPKVAGAPAADSGINPFSPPAASLDVMPVERGGFKSALPLAKAIGVVMVLNIVVELVGDLYSFLTIGVINRQLAAETVAESELTALDMQSWAITAVDAALRLVAAVLFCLFMPRANRNARAFGSPMTMTPGWAAGWFFVPIANLWKPYQAMAEIWQGSDPDPNVHPLQVSISSVIKWWWATYLIHNIIRRIIWYMSRNAQAEGLLVTSWVEIITSVVSIVAEVLAALVVLAVARRQDERQLRHPAGTPGALITRGAVP